MKITLLAITTLALLQTATPARAQSGRGDFPCSSNIVDNIDYPGNEPVNFEDGWAIFTAEMCCYICDFKPDCNAFTWAQYNDGRCYFKKLASQSVANNPAPDRSAYMRSAVIYKCRALQPNMDFIGSDLTSSPGTSADMCCGICRHTTGYTGFFWSEYNGGTCWLKKVNSVAAIYARSMTPIAIYY